jgi:hypothetical protein
VRPTFSPSSCCESWARMRAERMRVPTSVMATGTGLWGEKERRTTTRVAGRRNEPRRRDRPARREERNHGVAGDPERHGCRLLPEPTGLTPDGPPAKPRWGRRSGRGVRRPRAEIGRARRGRIGRGTGGRGGDNVRTHPLRACTGRAPESPPRRVPARVRVCRSRLPFAGRACGTDAQVCGICKRMASSSAYKYAREPPSTAPRTVAPRTAAPR